MQSLPAMDFVDAALPGTIATLFAAFAAVVVVFLAAVWFGLHVVAPKIKRALDRAETEEEQPGDRPD
jgi:hypothetical protein